MYLWITCDLFIVTFVVSLSIEEKLLQNLDLNSFDTRVQPSSREDNSSPIVVNCTRFSVDRILHLNQKTQTLDVLALIELAWYDERTSWNSSTEFGKIGRLRIAAEYIWLPDIALINGVGTQVPFDDLSEGGDKFVMLHPSGLVTYQLYLKLSSVCPVDAKLFPFDHQTCNLTFASWTTDRVIAAVSNESVKKSSKELSDHSEWIIDEALPHTRVLLNTSRPFFDLANSLNRSTFHRYGFIITLHLHRKSHYYLNNVFFPVTVLTILTLANIKIPAKCFKENIAMGLSIFIAQSWYLIMIAPEMPVTPTYLPLIGTCIVLSMGFSCITLSLSIIIIHVHLQTAKLRNSPPKWLLSLSRCVNGEKATLNEVYTEKTHEKGCVCISATKSYDLLSSSNNQMAMEDRSQTNPISVEEDEESDECDATEKEQCSTVDVSHSTLAFRTFPRKAVGQLTNVTERGVCNGFAADIQGLRGAASNGTRPLTQRFSVSELEEMTSEHLSAPDSEISCHGQGENLDNDIMTSLPDIDSQRTNNPTRTASEGRVEDNLPYLLMMYDVLEKKYKAERKTCGEKKVLEWEMVANAVNVIFFWTSLCLVVIGVISLMFINNQRSHL